MRKKFFLFFLGSFIFLFFVFFSYLVHKDLFTQFDFDTTVRFQDNINRRLDGPFSLLSDIGNFEVVTIILLLILLIRRKLSGFFVFFLYGMLHIFEIFGKIFVEHLPPPHFMLRTESILEFPRFYVRQEYSYPSGHSARAVFLGIILTILLLKGKKLTTSRLVIVGVIILYDVAMLVSRVYLGEHWSSDVIGGSLLGLGLGLVASIF